MHKFITIEGIDGVGKSSVVKFISDYVAQQSGAEVIVTREPGGTEIAEQIRNIILEPHLHETMHNDTELLLLFAGRVQHFTQLIFPALNQGKWVVSDRYIDSTYAYQGGGRLIDFNRIQQLEKWVLNGLLSAHPPVKTFLLDAPVEIALARAKHRSREDRIEQLNTAVFERIRQAYLDRAKKFPERIRVLDATQPLEKVLQELKSELDKLIVQISA